MIKFQIQMQLNNYNSASHTITKIVNVEDVKKYLTVIKAINSNLGKKTWNWFNRLPDTWSGMKYVIDNYRLAKDFQENFQVEMPADLIVDFFKKFTPSGADGISNIKVFKVEEIEV